MKSPLRYRASHRNSWTIQKIVFISQRTMMPTAIPGKYPATASAFIHIAGSRS